MLTVFRIVLPTPLTAAGMDRGCANGDVGAGVVGGGPSAPEGARSPLLGELKDLAGVVGGCKPGAFRVFATGRAGRAILGGPLEGREGFGSVVVIL